MVDDLIIDFLNQKGVYLRNTLVKKNAMELERDYILKNHTKKIWCGKDGNWYTRLDGRLIVRTKLEKLEDYIIEFLIENDRCVTPSLLLSTIFDEACSFSVDNNYLKKNSIDRYRCDWNRFVKNHDLSLMDITKITDIDIADFLNDTLNNFEITEKCFCNVKCLLLFIFSFAKTRKRIYCLELSKTLKDLKFTSRRFKRKLIDYNLEVFDNVEFRQFLDYVYYNYKNNKWLALLLVAHTGLRVGELVALKECDIHEDFLIVERQETRYRDDVTGCYVYMIDSCPKSNHIRRVYLSDAAKEVISLIREENERNNYDLDFLLSYRGKRLSTSQLNKLMNDICKTCGIPYRSMHKLRKTYGSRLFDSGASDKFIMSQMGHCSMTTFHQSYNYNLLTRVEFDNYAKDIVNKVIT